MDFSGIVSHNPGIDWNPVEQNYPINSPGLVSLNSNPVAVDQWVNRAAKFTNFGLPPQETTVPEYPSNCSIVYKRPVVPWVFDTTHLQLVEGMLTFVCRHKMKDPIYNVLPIYKMNIMLQECFNNIDDNDNFKTNLANYGERKILIGNQMYKLQGRKSDNAEYNKFLEQVNSDEYWALSKYGILNKYNFDGAVEYQSEFTGAGEHMVYHDSADIVQSHGIVLGQRANVSNIWGEVHIGDRLFLVLTRKKTAKGYGAFEFQPHICRDDIYPKFTYKDDSGDTQHCSIIYVGLCTESRKRYPDQHILDSALGKYMLVQQAYESYASLPLIQIQIRI